MSTARVDCFESRVAFVGGSPTFVTSASRSPWICTRSLRPRVEARRVRGAQTRTLFQPVCEAASPVPADEEESLDETAMRAAEIHEVLTGLEEFKARIVDDATKLAKKVRASKKDLKKSLENHPDIIKIDHHLAQLREELELLGDR